jgi:acyl carrier protein
MDKNEIYATLKKLLTDKFEIKSDLIGPKKLLDDDLDMDSLDAVDLLLYMEDHLTRRPDPALFKNARTVQDLVDILHPLWRGNVYNEDTLHNISTE